MSESVTPWTAAHQAPLASIFSQNLLRFMSIESVMKAHRIICCPPFLLPSIFPSLRIFSNELSVHIKWLEYWSFSFSINPSNLDWFPLGLTGLFSLLSKRLLRVFSSSRVWKHQLFYTQLMIPYDSTHMNYTTLIHIPKLYR